MLKNRIEALKDVIQTKLEQHKAPLGMAAIVRIAKDNGCTAADARLAIHKMVEAGRLVFVPNPLTVCVALAEGGDQ